MTERAKSLRLSGLITNTLSGLSPIQTIMKMAEERSIVSMGLDPANVISFGGGWCNHRAPEELRVAYMDIVNSVERFHESGRYSPIIGDHRVRAAICRLEGAIYGVKGLETVNVAIGHSSTQLFHDVLRVIADPGDRIAFLDPTYANYLNAAKCALRDVWVDYVPALDPETWQYMVEPEGSLEVLKALCSRGLKAFIVPVPDNPTSQIPPHRFMKGAREIMADHGGFMVIDFAYKALWFHDTMPQCYSWSPADYENLITLHSNSKWLSSLGRRMGWLEASEGVINGLERVNESVLLSPDTLHSRALVGFLERAIDTGILKRYIEDIRSLYRSTAEVMIRGIDRELGWKRLEPQGGLYTVCPTPHGEEPGEFVEEVLKATSVLLIPGTGFGPSMAHALRLSYGPLCYDHDLINEGIRRLGEYLSGGH